MNSKPPSAAKPIKRRTQAERSQETQRKIIASALRLLQDVGYQHTNLQEIARGAEVTLGAVQHQFGTRNALMERLVDEVMAPLGELGWVDEGDIKSEPLESRARIFVQAAWDRVYGTPNYVAAWGMFFGCKTTPTLLERIDEHRAQHDPLYFAHFVDTFPEIACNHPQPENFAAVILAAMRGLSVLGLFKLDSEATRLQLDVVAQMIVQAGRDQRLA